MASRRWLAVCGAAAIVLVVLAFSVVGGDTPDEKASADKVVSFYRDNNGASMAAALMLAIAAVHFALVQAHVLVAVGEGTPLREVRVPRRV